VKALVLVAPGVVEVRDEPEPVVSEDECLVHVRSAGICGSELHGARTPGFRQPPLIMGHEFAGVTEQGDRVVVNPILSCGRCRLCRSGQRQICAHRQIIGVHRPGGFADRVAVPRSAVRPVPPGLPLDTAALIEPAANAVHAWNRATTASPPTENTRTGVIGCGAIGLFCLLVALSNGMRRVHVADLSPARLAIARRLGAASAGSRLEGEFDIIVDAVGLAATRGQSVDRQRPGGLAVWLGLADAEPGYDAAGLVRSEKRVIGSFAYSDQEFAEAAGLLAGWDLTWASRHPLSAGAQIFTELMHGAPHPVKAVLQP